MKPPPAGAFPRTSFHSAQFLSYIDAQVTANVGANDPRNRLKCLGGAAATSERRAEAVKGERVFVDLPSLASPLRTRSRFPPNPPSIRHLTSGGEQKKQKNSPPGTLVGGAIWSRPRLAIGPAVGTRAASVPLFNERI